MGTVTFLGRVASGPRVPIRAVVTPDLTGPPLVGWRDLQALGVLPRAFPSVGQEVLGLDVDVLCLGGEHAINMVLVDEGDLLSLGVGTDSLDKIKVDFKDVLVTSLGDAAGIILGPKMRIELDETRDIRPLHVTTARQVPVHIQPMARKLMKELAAASAVVRCFEPTEWCSSGHFLLKACGLKARLITDFQALNKAVKRPLHPFNSAVDLMRKVRPDARCSSS
jgi:hypothetical protein